MRTWQLYREENHSRINYLKLLFQTRVYLILEKWVLEEAQRAYFTNYHTKVGLDEITREQLKEELESDIPSLESSIHFQEEWEIESSSTKSDNYVLTDG